MNEPTNATACAALVGAWAGLGVKHAVIAPGSRSTPLALALAREPRIRTQVVLDERAGGFRALGIGRATGMPAIAVCTSGTAASHFHAAVIESWHGRVPLIVCSADRPPELRDTGAGQTIDQTQLFAGTLRWFADPGPPGDAALFASIAARAVAAAVGAPAGPVHLNLPFREPLVDGRDPEVSAIEPVVSRSGVVAPTAAMVDELFERVVAESRGMLLVGWGAGVSGETVESFAAASGWPVLADTISNARAGTTIAHYEALLRATAWAGAHRPELVVRCGAALTSKTLNQWLDPDVVQVLVDPDGAWLDPSRSVSLRLQCDAELVLQAVTARLRAHPRDRTWRASWVDADATARTALGGVLDAEAGMNEPRLARDVFAALPDGVQLLVASSMPVRDLEWFAVPRDGVQVHANRGANGIDGLISTAIGIAVGSQAPTVAMLGDLAFLHDAGGLLGAADLDDVSLTILVIDNHGGAIFSFLPQADLLAPSEFDRFFATPHDVDIATLAAAHGVAVQRVTVAAELVPALLQGVRGRGVRVIVAEVIDREANVALHRAAWDAVAQALATAG